MIAVHVFDTIRGDFRRAASLPIGYAFLESQATNFMRIPPGVDRTTWYGELSQLFCLVTGLWGASAQLLANIMESAERRLDGARPLTLIDVYEQLRSYKPRGEERKYWSRLMMRLEHVLWTCPHLLYEIGLPYEHFIEERTSVIWEMPKHELARSLTIGHRLLFWFVYRNANRVPPQLLDVLFIDEAPSLLQAADPASGIGLMARVLNHGRGLGLAAVIASQSVATIHRSVLDNVVTVAAFRSQGQNVRDLATLQQLTGPQARELSQLPVGEAVVTVGGRLPAVRVHVPEVICDE